ALVGAGGLPGDASVVAARRGPFAPARLRQGGRARRDTRCVLPPPDGRAPHRRIRLRRRRARARAQRIVVIVVADAGPLIHLSLVRLLRLLPILYEQVPHDPGAPLLQLLRAQLDPGEAAAIWVAVERKAALVLSDDRPARLAA